MTGRFEDLPPSERVDDIPRVLQALRKAVRAALKEHKLAGNPVPIWENGKVVWVQPEDIPDTDEQYEQTR